MEKEIQSRKWNLTINNPVAKGYTHDVISGKLKNFAYPCVLPSRYNDRIACYTKVYILSNVDLRCQYKEIQENNVKTWEAFLRRIKHVHVYKKDVVETFSVTEYFNMFHVMSSEEIKNCPFIK